MKTKEVISVYGNFANEEEYGREVEKIHEEWNETWSNELAEQKYEDNRKSITAQKVYYCEYDYRIEDGQRFCSSEITTDKNRAKELDKHYRLASIDEVNMWIDDLECEDGFIKIIETSDGIFGWYEQEYISGLGDEEFYCGYIFLQPNSEWEIEDLRRCIEKMRNEKMRNN